MDSYRSTSYTSLIVVAVVLVMLACLLLYGCSTTVPGPNLFTRVRVTSSEVNPGIGHRVDRIALGSTSTAVRGILGDPSQSETGDGLELWTYSESKSREETRYFLGLLRTGAGSQSSLQVHEMVFQDDKLIQKSHADPVSPKIRCQVGRLKDRLMKSPFYGLLDKIQAGKTTRAELLSLLAPPTEMFRKDDLEVLNFILSSKTSTSAPGEASASATSESLSVSLAGGIVVEAPYSTTADDALRKRFEGWRGWSR